MGAMPKAACLCATHMHVVRTDTERAVANAETHDRTGDLQIFSLTLSQLSYRSLLIRLGAFLYHGQLSRLGQHIVL